MTLKDSSHYGIIFEESNLSLQKIEQLIYERNCIQNLSEKAFESLQLLSKKISDLEYVINNIREEKHKKEEKIINQIENIEKEDANINNINNIKGKIENNNNIEYSEKSINNIKKEFKNMVEDIELLNTNNNNGKYIQKNIILDTTIKEESDKTKNNKDFLSD